MAQRNKNLARLPAGYLFPEIDRRRRVYLERHPQARIVSLGVGNTTQPLTPHIVNALKNAALDLGTEEGYSGYGDGAGMIELRRRIAERLYDGIVDAEEVFISDGAKCDCGRVQALFGGEARIAVQDPAYPVYVDGSVIVGATGGFGDGRFAEVVYMACHPGNGFFPDLEALPKVDLIYFCSPNNPTGAVATRQQLADLVAFAKDSHAIVIFDSAYSTFIRDESLPRSIFEIEGAREVAMEISSFSKMIGFTGVRLGWSIVPKELIFDDGYPVMEDWSRIVTTIFNGASNIVQHGGIAALEDEGLAEMKETVDYYLENAHVIKRGLDEMGVENYGGVNAPYIWARFPGQDSWDVFAKILEEAQVVVTPGSGFGPASTEFIRFSAFGHREDIAEAVRRLQAVLGK
jgi:LL-diaminopimelate aminotransferase